MTAVEFKIVDAADQQFAARLGNRRCTMRLRYNPTNQRWSFNLAIDDQMVLHGRRIVTGVDLLRAYHFGIGLIFAGSEGKILVEPGRSELINGLVKLYHMTEEDYEQLAIQQKG